MAFGRAQATDVVLDPIQRRDAPIRHVISARDILVRARVAKFDLATTRDSK